MTAVFRYARRALWCESQPLAAIAEQAGTPVYVYSRALIERNFQRFERAFGSHPHLLCYSVKANSNLGLLRLLGQMGAGFDIVSGGELHRVRKAGCDAARVVFSGVGKTAEEVDAALAAGILMFNAESEAELAMIEQRAARANRRARVALRVNPDVDAATHPYIATGLREHKFGVDFAQAHQIYLRTRRRPHLEVAGVTCHIGSQILQPEPFLEALDKLLDLAERLRRAGLAIRYLDIGGGLGVAYRPEEKTPDAAAFVRRILERLEGRDYVVLLEPGRSVVAEAGVLLTRVLYTKRNGNKNFVIVDAAMNDLLRPALYGSHHEILPVRRHPGGTVVADVVGPVCETGDFLARDRRLPALRPGDLLAILTAGAYGASLGSNYNSRLRPPEVLVEGRTFRLLRRRETYADLVRNEMMGVRVGTA